MQKKTQKKPKRAFAPPTAGFRFNWKNYKELAGFTSDRAKIHSRSRTGLSAGQQKKLATAIKRARHLGLLPFAQKVR